MKAKQKIQMALKNIDIVIANATMTRAEHNQLLQDVMLIKQRCELAEKLEKEQIKCQD